MDWNKDRSVRLTAAFTVLFSVILLAADIFGFIWMPWYASVSAVGTAHLPSLSVTIYASSVFAWICLYAMLRLLKGISSGQVFTAENTLMLRVISWCCAGACLIFLASVLYYPPFLIVSAAAGFMMMIVRVIKNIFQQAISMKAELDLTV